MATIINLEVRKTFHYVGTCQHLDKWERVGRAKVLPERLVREGNGLDDQGTYLVHARIPAGQDSELSRRALAHYFTSEGCAHEYDCCGCWSQWATVRQLNPRTFSVRIRRSRNY